jgi:hypothetical protein
MLHLLIAEARIVDRTRIQSAGYQRRAAHRQQQRQNERAAATAPITANNPGGTPGQSQLQP